MDIRSKMRPSFAALQGGLFSKVSKADVGGGFEKMRERGVTMMSWADPFFPDPSTPSHVCQRAIELLQGGRMSHYTMPIGNAELKELFAEQWKNRTGMELDAQRNILITPGSDSGLLYAVMPFIEQGDEVLVPDPSYPSNFLDPVLLGGVTVSVPLKKETGYHLDLEAFRQAITPRTKMVLLTNPNNPTTTVFNRDELTQLSEIIVANDLICVCDQAFEDSVFDDHEMVSIATLPGMWERTLTVCSISKGMGLSGFRVGYIVADDVIMDVLFGGAVNIIGATGTLQQEAAIAAMKEPSFIEEYTREYDYRRQYAYEKFNEVPGVKMYLPEATFLCWVDVSELGDSSEIAEYLIQEALVSCNDGKPYGKMGAGHLRFVLGACGQREEMQAAIDRVCNALRKYKKTEE